MNIGRSFFEQLPMFSTAQRTLANTYLSAPLTYDYFCKRSKTFVAKEILLSEDRTDKATLYECEYTSNIINLKECFYNTKFVDCKNWFDQNDETNTNIINVIDSDNISRNRNYIVTGDGDISERGFVYYKYNNVSGSYEKCVLDNDIIDDCFDNYTDFVPQNAIDNKGGILIWYNHDLLQDFTYYGNIKEGVKPFDPVNGELINTIQKTYCCLPPDILYGCGSSAVVDSIFANSNIIGVIPRNLTKKIKNQPITNILRNVNIMPNIEYYYDVNNTSGGLNGILNEITDVVDIVGDTIGEEYSVVFRDEYGILKKRKPVASDRNLGQFVYVPSNFTTSGNLMNAFNFRYNLPRHWEMPSKFTKPDGSTVGYYKSTHELNNAIISGELDTNTLPYHSQYFFITDKCVKWENVYDAKNVFISSDQDIDFSNKNILDYRREYYDGNVELSPEQKNAWTIDQKVSTAMLWSSNSVENFYIDLNLCGKKNDYNMVEDYGCPVVIKNRNVHLDNFVSGVLTVFLNGRVFNDTFIVNDLMTSNHKSSGSSTIIGYYGFGKNIILPKFNGIPLDDKIVFIPIDNEFIYYDFMVDNDITSMNNYYKYFAEGRLSTNKDLFDKTKNKYTFK